MDKSEKAREPISSHDIKALKEYFDKHFPNPEGSIAWKLIRYGDHLVEHKNAFIRWGSLPFVLAVFLPIGLYDWAKNRATKRAAKKNWPHAKLE